MKIPIVSLATRLRRFGGTALVCALPLLACALPAQAQTNSVIFNLLNSPIAATPGSTVTLTAFIQNQSTTTTYYINGLQGDSSDPSVTVDEFSFAGYFAAQYPTFSLAPGQSYTGNFVDILVSNAAPSSLVVTGNLALLGGATPAAQNTFQQHKYEVDISAVMVPEASTGLLTFLALSGTALGIYARRKRIA